MYMKIQVNNYTTPIRPRNSINNYNTFLPNIELIMNIDKMLNLCLENETSFNLYQIIL
jgi:hypothetical protein